jgi:hypothetical protein
MCLLQQHAQVFVIKHTLLASDNKRSQFLFLEKKWQHKTFDMVPCAAKLGKKHLGLQSK